MALNQKTLGVELRLQPQDGGILLLAHQQSLSGKMVLSVQPIDSVMSCQQELQTI